MREERERRGGRVAAVAIAGLAFAATWIALNLKPDRPRWLSVEAPATAVVGRTLEIRVTLRKAVAASQVHCALQRANAQKRDWGFLASAGTPQPAVRGRTYTFVFEVPEREATAYAFALIFLSPSGRWEDATRAAATKYMPVAGEAAAGEIPGLARTPVFYFPTYAAWEKARAKGERPQGRPSVWVHPVIAVLLLAGAALAVLRAGRKDALARPGENGERTAWLILAVLLAASVALELTGIADDLSEWGRRLAQERGVYYLRRPAQKAVLAAVAAAAIALFLLFIRAVRRPGPHRYLWGAGTGLAVYLAVSFVTATSFHPVDVARGLIWRGVSPLDALRGAGAAAAFVAALLSLRDRTAPRTAS